MTYQVEPRFVQSRFYTGWTQAENDECAMLWKANYSARQIGERLGRSRNAVLGKINRMGLHRTTGKRRGAMK